MDYINHREDYETSVGKITYHKKGNFEQTTVTCLSSNNQEDVSPSVKLLGRPLPLNL
jgi:hypothetical protein